MSRSTKVKGFMLLIQLTAMMTFMSAGVARAADAITLAASEPATIYYTTNGAAPTMPTASYPLVSGQAPVESPEDKLRNKELKKKLLKKYDIYNDTFTIRVEHTPHGPKGYISMYKRSSDKTAENKNSTEIEANTRSRLNAIAREFLTEEAELFGITDLDELRETRYETDDLGFTIIEFQRYIDQLPLENSTIRIFVRSSGEVSEVTARVTPSPPELYEAAKKETLPESRAREIAEVALREVNYDANTNLSIRRHMRASKVAISAPPYVLWKVESYWNIFIDAFSGAVVDKIPNVIR